jgi:hypothetical protein
MEEMRVAEERPPAGGCLAELGWLGAGFVLPCASLTFYRRAARRRVVGAVAFFALFTLLISGLQTLGVGRGLLLVRGNIRRVFESGRFPEIEIRGGLARVNAEQPLVLLDDGDSIFVLDTTGSYRRLDRSTHSMGFLLTRTSLHVMSRDGRYEEVPLETLHTLLGGDPIVVNADSASRFWVGFAAIATPVAFLGLALWHVLIRFVYLAMLGLVIWGVVALVRPGTGFGPVLITGLYALVPAMYAHYLLGRLGIGFITLQTLLLLPLWSVALAAALAAPGRSILGQERSLRGWRALFGVPMLLVFALDIVLAPRWGAPFGWLVAWLTFVSLAAVGLWSAWKETQPNAAR